MKIVQELVKQVINPNKVFAANNPKSQDKQTSHEVQSYKRSLVRESESCKIFYSTRLQSSSTDTEPDVVVDLLGELIFATVVRVDIVLLVLGACLFVSPPYQKE